MKRRNLFGRLATLEEEMGRRERPRAVYLRTLFAYLRAAGDARHGGGGEAVAKASALRKELHALAGREA